VGVYVTWDVEEGVKDNVVVGVGGGEPVSLSVGVDGGCGVKNGVGVSLATVEGMGPSVIVWLGV